MTIIVQATDTFNWSSSFFLSYVDFNSIFVYFSLTGHCSHVIGLLKYLQGLKLHNISTLPDQLSCTSVPQQWHVPRGEKIEPVPLNHVVVAKPCETRKRKPVLCQVNTQDKWDFMNKIRTKMTKFNVYCII